MKNKIIFSIVLSSLLILVSTPLSSAGNKNKANASATNTPLTSTASTGKVGSVYRLYMNNINLPFDNKGIIAHVNIPDPIPQNGGAGGKFDDEVFLFSSGFFLSGYANGNLFSNGIASSALMEDYVPGTVESGPSDPRAQIYVVKSMDNPFSQSWQDWKDAVSLGADYYDGDNDGIYNPVDLNGNMKWDANEDRPDLLGDETAWCVYNDGLPTAQRRWSTVAPLGIEVRQTIFGISSAGINGNILFIRYRIKYTGLNNPDEANKLDSVYFGIWADPDIGDPENDLVGCDTIRNIGITYNYGSDYNSTYASRPPVFFIDYLSGPAAYIAGETFTDLNSNNIYDEGIDIPLDTAFQRMGEIKGVKQVPGAKNLGASSFVQFINENELLHDPYNALEANNSIRGFTTNGNLLDPCTFEYGDVGGGVNCRTINKKFWYSGNPVTATGWVNTAAADARHMTNTGPFTINKGEEKEIFIAYTLGREDGIRSSFRQARIIDDATQIMFDNNKFNGDTAKTIPDIPELISPYNKDSEVERSDSLVWRNVQGAEKYRLQVYEYVLSSKLVIDTLINSAYHVAGLKSGMQYKWQVSAQNQIGSSDFSDSYSFMMIMEPPELTVETISGGVNKLTWIDKSNNTSRFHIDRRIKGYLHDLHVMVDSTVHEFYDSTAVPGERYCYNVLAVSSFLVKNSERVCVNTLTGVDDTEVIPTEFSIKQNHPNPFNPSTIIEYSLPAESNVKVTLYNSLGETVVVLAGGIKPAGNYQVNFNAADLASGIYFYTIKAESTDGSKTFWDIKKMMLLK